MKTPGENLLQELDAEEVVIFLEIASNALRSPRFFRQMADHLDIGDDPLNQMARTLSTLLHRNLLKS